MSLQPQTKSLHGTRARSIRPAREGLPYIDLDDPMIVELMQAVEADIEEIEEWGAIPISSEEAISLAQIDDQALSQIEALLERRYALLPGRED